VYGLPDEKIGICVDANREVFVDSARWEDEYDGLEVGRQIPVTKDMFWDDDHDALNLLNRVLKISWAAAPDIFIMRDGKSSEGDNKYTGDAWSLTFKRH
jgi:hypothetical protein